MRLHRFYLGQEIGEQEGITLTDKELIHQLVNVFRLKSGDRVILFDGSGFEYETEIILINKKEIKLKIITVMEKKIKSDKNISLFLSVIKKNNFELATEKCTEIGVTEIHPVISERSEKKSLNIERLQKIVKEASEQSGRVTLPQVFEVVSLEEAVSQVVKEGKAGVVFHTTTSSSKCHSSLKKEKMPSPLSAYFRRSTESARGGGIVAFVGPEGGWTEAEIKLFKQNNFKILSLGQNILRAETAAIIATFALLKT